MVKNMHHGLQDLGACMQILKRRKEQKKVLAEIKYITSQLEDNLKSK